MSTGRAICNMDILQEIFEHLSIAPRHVTQVRDYDLYGDEATAKRQTLASAALVCKTFSEPASRMLWTTLHRGIGPLMRVFSNSKEPTLWPLSSQRIWYIEGETTALEWAQFERLAARVRCLVFDVRPEIAPSTVDLLKVRWETSAEPLFPSLSILEWPDSSNDTQHQLLQVICATQTLSSFVIKHGFRYDTILPSTDLFSIARSSPSLSHLHIKAYWQVSWYAPLITFHNLRSIRMQSVSPAFYRHLGSLPSLEYIRAYVLPVEDQWEMSPPSSYRGFARLRSLEIPDRTSVPPSTLVDMLFPVTSLHLTSLVLGVQATRPSDVLSFLESACSLDTLRSLRRFHLMVERAGNCIPEPAAYTFSDMYKSLSKLRSLEEVAIQICTAAIEFTDADVAQVPAAWPQLTSFSVTGSSLGADAMSPSRGGAPVARPSLTALVGLAQALSSLEELDVEIADVPDTELAHLEGCAGSRPPQKALTRIAFAHHGYRADLMLPDVKRLGHVLHKMFPNLGAEALARDQSSVG